MRVRRKRELLMLLEKLEPSTSSRGSEFKQGVSGWYLSVKVDGQLTFWDGGVSTGIPAHLVPWANTAKDTRDRIATGLWTRGGKPVHAPEWWIAALPKRFLVGEIYGVDFQYTMSCVRKFIPEDHEWRNMRYYLFDAPSQEEFCASGYIHQRDWHLEIDGTTWHAFIEQRRAKMGLLACPVISLERFCAMKDIYTHDHILVHEQEPLPFSTAAAEARVTALFNQVVDGGGEGIVVRDPYSVWTPYRSKDVLKMKAEEASNGSIVGIIAGKVGLHFGAMGSLLVSSGGVEFGVNGFNAQERTLNPADAAHAETVPGEIIRGVVPTHFTLGQTINFVYMSKTKDGVPRHAVYRR